MWFPVLLLVWPLVEIGLFVTVGSWLGLWSTLAIVIGTGVLGVWLIRRQGMRAGEGLQRAMAARREPGAGLAEIVLGLGSGFLLILPGFLTDALGALLLVPAVRRWVARRLVRAGGPVGRQAPEVIDGKWEVLPPEGSRRPPSGWTAGPDPRNPDRRD